jgi:hypothetical protein
MIVILRLILLAREGGYSVEDKSFCLVYAIEANERANSHGGFRRAGGEN